MRRVMTLTERRKIETLCARVATAHFKEGVAAGCNAPAAEAKRARDETRVAEQNLAAYLKVITSELAMFATNQQNRSE